MHLCLFEDDGLDHLWPLAASRAVYDLRLGLRTLLDTTREAFPSANGTLLHSRDALGPVTARENDLLTNRIPGNLDVLFVNGRFVAEDGPALERLRAAAANDEAARVFTSDGDVVAAWMPEAAPGLLDANALTRTTFGDLPEEELPEARLVGRLWHLLDGLEAALRRDYAARASGYNILQRPEARVHEAATLTEPERIVTAKGCTVRPGAVLDATEGPIYLAENTLVEEGAVVRGPCCVGPQSVIKAHAVIEDSAFGYYCKVGGEVERTVVHSLSNKAHPGFLGDSYVGRWCNFGADSNNSNLKNDYGDVTLYDRAEGDFVDTERQFMGLVMGDHSKCGINTMFNTGTVVGVFCNLFGGGFMPRHVPDFSWGGTEKRMRYRTDKALRVAETVMARRDRELSDAGRDLLRAIADRRETAG
jgi:UDP-N-acetylglucosamine diphosphorylase/glucosamine-1-phosphate N-acetyltransferase